MSLLTDRMDAPAHLGAMESPSAVGAVGNPACGDVVTLYLRIEDEVITEASFESMGSRFQLATASVLCDCITGQDIDAAAARGPDCVLAKLPDLPPRNQYLARLALDALQRAVRRYRRGDGEVEHLEPVSAEQVERLVRGLLAVRPLGTLELEAMAEAEGYHLPGGAARCLSRLRRAGVIRSEMTADKRGWRWSLV